MPDNTQEKDSFVAEDGGTYHSAGKFAGSGSLEGLGHDPSIVVDKDVTPDQFVDYLVGRGDYSSFVGVKKKPSGLAPGEIGTYDPDELNINTEDIRATAAAGRQHIARIDELIVEMQNEMSASEAIWAGDAANWYRDVFLTATNRFRKSLEDFSAYTTELVSYADEYEGVDSRAQIIADSAEQPDC